MKVFVLINNTYFKMYHENHENDGVVKTLKV
jgi:hypothetical protein